MKFKQRFVPLYHGFLNKLKTIFGNPIAISDANGGALMGLRIFGKSTQDGTPTPDAPVDIVSVENPKVNVDSQTLSIPYTIHGIPVTSGGNYTDANGQQWICDEVDFERGVYVQRIVHKTIADFTSASVSTPNGGYTEGRIGIGANVVNKQIAVSSHFPFKSSGNEIRFACASSSIYFTLKGDLSRDEWITQMNTIAPVVVVAVETPIETPLTAAQIEAYKSLHTNEPNTTISNDQNAWMEVKYISK